MSLKSFEKEINILKKNLNRDSLIINREKVLGLTGTESSYTIIKAFKDDLNKNKEVINALLLLIKNPEELNDLDIDINEIPLIKDGKLKGITSENIEDKLLEEYFDNNTEFIGAYQSTKRNLNKIYANVLTREDGIKDEEFEKRQIEYVKYTEQRVRLDGLSKKIMGKNFELNNNMSDADFERYRMEFTGTVATVYTEKKDSTVIDVKDGKATILKSNNKLVVDEELITLLEDNKYINKIEIDSQTDLKKLKEFLIEISENEFATEESIYLKIRFLGRHNATGLYYPGLKVLAVSVTDEYSFAHEMAHHMDFTGGITNREEILSYIAGFNDYQGQNNLEYYANPHEIIARAGEFSYALMQSDFVNIYEAYKAKTEYNGEIVTEDNFRKLIINSSKSTRLANDLEYYIQYQSVYFGFNDRTMEELSFFYTSFQKLYKFDKEIEVVKSSKQDKVDVIEETRLKKQGIKRVRRTGFKTYSKEDFDSVFSEYEKGNIDLFTKQEFYIKALLSYDNNYKFYVMEKLLLDKDSETIISAYLKEVEYEVIELKNNLMEEQNVELSEEDIYQFILFGRNAILSDFTVNLSRNRNMVKSFLIKDEELKTVLNFASAANISNIKIMLEKIISVKQFKYQDDLNKYIAIYKNTLSPEDKIKYAAAASLIEMENKRTVQGYFLKELKKLGEEDKQSVILNIIEGLEDIPNNFKKQSFITENLEFIPIEYYSKLSIVSPHNIKEYMENNTIEEIYKLYQDGDISLIPLANNIMENYNSKERSNIFRIYRELVDKLNSFQPHKLIYADNATYNQKDNKILTETKELEVEGIYVEDNQVILVNSHYYKTGKKTENDLSRLKIQAYIKDNHVEKPLLLEDEEEIKRYFGYASYSSRVIPKYVYINPGENSGFAFNEIEKLNQIENPIKLELENKEGKKQDIRYKTDLGSFEIKEDSELEVKYNKPNLNISIISYLGSNFDAAMVQNTETEEELLAIVFNLIIKSERDVSALFEKSSFINEVDKKYGATSSIKLSLMYLSELIKENKFTDYIDFKAMMPHSISLSTNPDKVMHYLNELINSISGLTNVIKTNVLEKMEDNLSANDTPRETIDTLKANLSTDLEKVSIKIIMQIYDVFSERINSAIDFKIHNMWKDDLGLDINKDTKYSLNDILDKVKEANIEDKTMNYILENTKSVKKMTIKDFTNFYRQNFNTNLSVDIFNIGDKNIFDYSELTAKTTRKATGALKADDKKRIYETTTIKETKELSNKLLAFNKLFNLKEWSEGDYIHNKFGFIKLLNSINELLETPKKFKTEVKETKKTTKKTTKKSTKKD
jgi:hypothetical protein